VSDLHELVFDPMDPSIWQDPYPHYRLVRDSAPVYFVETRDFWLVSRYDDIRTALRDCAQFSSDVGVFQTVFAAAPPKPGSLREAQLGMGRESSPRSSMIMMDPPDHRRLRNELAPSFRQPALAELEQTIVQLCAELVDRVLEAGASGDADIMRDLAIPLPLNVASALLGIPASDHEYISDLTRQFVALIGGSIDPEGPKPSPEVMPALAGYVEELLRHKISHPSPDLTSRLADGSTRGRLSHAEALAQVLLILVAGFETTTNLIGNFFKCCFEFPDELQLLRDDQSLIPCAVEEALRFESPLQCIFRTVPEDVLLNGVCIPGGSYVELYLASGNRDERHFPNPDVFSVRRNPRDHLGFAPGIHNCLGAPIARLEARVAISALLTATKVLEQDGPIEMMKNMTIRGAKSIPVKLKRR
jgi:cytochrome P450